ncbi:MAG: ribosome maturation factor RimP [Candidatus Omnitrophica bacterium]|nr:ribosome maturation factor RimP [Candidatus Omnitrophota bacterium]
MNELLSEQVKQAVLPVLDKENVELVELQLNRGKKRLLLRFLVDRPGGITLDECAHLNREIGRIFDQQNVVQDSYILEVSSPGLDRPLKSTRDFQRAQAKLIRVVLHQELNRQNVWKGRLVEISEKEIAVQTEDGASQRIPRELIARASVEVEI